MSKTQEEMKIGRFGQVCGFPEDAGHAEALAQFAARLREVPADGRKLLAHATELAYREHHDGRKQGVAYLPELHETCGLGVDEMYGLLNQLAQSEFIQVEGEYPFQDVALNAIALRDCQWPVMRDLWRFCNAERIALRDVVVDLDFERLV